MTVVRMDLDRAVEIARDPAAATGRERRTAFYWSAARLDEEDAGELTHFDRRRLVAARHQLTIFPRVNRAEESSHA